MKKCAFLLSFAMAVMAHAAESEPAAKRERRFYAEAGPAVARVGFTPKVGGVSAGSDTKTFYGVDAAFGTEFGRSKTGWHQLGAEVMVAARNDDSGAADITSYVSTHLALYNYHFAIADAASFYVGPCAGVVVLGRTVETASGDSSDSDGALAAGLQLGVTAKCSDLVWLNFGYRGLVSDEVYLNKYATRYEDLTVHMVKADVTFRF